MDRRSVLSLLAAGAAAVFGPAVAWWAVKPSLPAEPFGARIYREDREKEARFIAEEMRPYLHKVNDGSITPEERDAFLALHAHEVGLNTPSSLKCGNASCGCMDGIRVSHHMWWAG